MRKKGMYKGGVMRWRLFANGKFKVKHMNGNIYKLRGHDNGHPSDPNIRLGNGSWAFKQNCTLIARPISDMTDEECENIIPITGIPYDIEIFKEDYAEVPIENLTVAEFNAFCDIGVINWNQMFDDGTVIDGSKLEEA